jgi:integrase
VSRQLELLRVKKEVGSMIADEGKAQREQILRQQMRTARKRSNDLRRTFGTWLRKQGVDPSLIAPAMGHADSRMVERVYGRLPPENLRSQIAAAVSVKFPRESCAGAGARP